MAVLVVVLDGEMVIVQHTHTYNTILGDQEIMSSSQLWNQSHTEMLKSK